MGPLQSALAVTLLGLVASVRSPSSSYGAPRTTYGAPAVSSSYGAPAVSSSYGAPAPKTTYGAPAVSSSYGAPAVSSSYGAPAPKTSYGAPAVGSGHSAPQAGARVPLFSGSVPGAVSSSRGGPRASAPAGSFGGQRAVGTTGGQPFVGGFSGPAGSAGFRAAFSGPGGSVRLAAADPRGYYFSWVANDLQPGAKYSWDEADNHCRLRGYRLVSLKTPEKDKYIASVLAQSNIEYTWTSGTRRGRNFAWGDSTPVRGYTNWSRTGSLRQPQPDNFEGEENCIALVNGFYNDGIVWHDVACHHKKHFICEIF